MNFIHPFNAATWSAWICVILVAYPVACYGRGRDSIPLTVCDVVQWDKSVSGKEVRLKAKYFSDFKHETLLQDAACPAKYLTVDAGLQEPDRSVLDFEAYIWEHYDYYVGRKFNVDILGVFEWNDEILINAELPPDRRKIIPAHGGISIMKVFSFEKAVEEQ